MNVAFKKCGAENTLFMAAAQVPLRDFKGKRALCARFPLKSRGPSRLLLREQTIFRPVNAK